MSDKPLVKLRRPRVEDAIALAEHANDPQIFAGLRDYFPSPYSIDDALRFIDTALEKPAPHTDWLIHADGEVVGVMGLFIGEDVYRYNAEIGYWVARKHWGRGIATKAICQAVSYAWGALEVDRIYAEIFAINKGSLRALQKCGFEFEYRLPNVIVKLGRRSDAICMAIRKPT